MHVHLFSERGLILISTIPATKIDILAGELGQTVARLFQRVIFNIEKSIPCIERSRRLHACRQPPAFGTPDKHPRSQKLISAVKTSAFTASSPGKSTSTSAFVLRYNAAGKEERERESVVKMKKSSRYLVYEKSRRKRR